MLIGPDDSVDYVADDITDAEIPARFDINQVLRSPRIDVCVGLDRPLAGLGAITS